VAKLRLLFRDGTEESFEVNEQTRLRPLAKVLYDGLAAGSTVVIGIESVGGNQSWTTASPASA
jgi:hypothetical protein